MRISDWSSDVCSSDLGLMREGRIEGVAAHELGKGGHGDAVCNRVIIGAVAALAVGHGVARKGCIRLGVAVAAGLNRALRRWIFGHVPAVDLLDVDLELAFAGVSGGVSTTLPCAGTVGAFVVPYRASRG